MNGIAILQTSFREKEVGKRRATRNAKFVSIFTLANIYILFTEGPFFDAFSALCLCEIS